MRTTSLPGLLILALVPVSGCAQASDPKLVAGTYSVTVSAFGKSDPVIVVASAGAAEVVLLNFTYGITTDYGAENATGLRGNLDGSELSLDSQPIHVDHSTGVIDGTVVGTGSAGGATLELVLKVSPTNVTLIDDMPYVPGTTIDYMVTGPKQ